MSARGPRLPWHAAVLGTLLGALFASVVWAPARWVDVALAAASDGRLRLLQPAGTLWAGSGVLRVAGDGGALTVPGRLRWTLTPDLRAPGARLTLQPDAAADAPWRATLARRDGSWWLQAEPWQAQLDLAWLQALGAPWNTFGLQGRAHLAWPALRWPLGASPPAAASSPAPLTIELLDVAAAVSPLRPLGSYRLTLQAAPGAAPTFALDTLRGDLRLQASGGWPGGRLQLQGLAEANPERLDALSNLLNLLGRRDGARAHLRIGNPA
ncbi:type II secretion system protein N [Tepidimonas sp.]|uniref:type II secretion system protein N n=1 Tax=Tepidimonas sp. TaxID=2002775 RepID=UPI00391A6069